MSLLFLNEGINFPPDVKLVYLTNNEEVPDVDGTTYLAKIIKSSRDNHEVILLTNADGTPNNSNIKRIINDSSIIKNSKIKTIQPRKIYHLTDNDVIAKNFAIKGQSLESISRTALGSGIYGYYVPNRNQLHSLQKDQLIYEIDMKNAYAMQDKFHNQSISNASLFTNKYLDIIVNYNLRNDNEIVEYFNSADISNLVTLWNIVFYRTNHNISYELLESILISYLTNYYLISDIKDTRTGEELIELPINYIMRSLGYTGLIASDSYSNSTWDRGCVSYQYEQAEIFIGGKALW